MGFDLTVVSAGIIAFGIIMYVILDGFDLGIGILYPLAPDERSRDVMINSIAPVWDGNETWLVLGGATLFAAFPVAYALLLPILHVPIMAMLFALILRGVAFEFRPKAGKSKRLWTTSFAAGSAVAAFSQGAMLGAFIEGFPMSEGRVPEGGVFAWMSLFSATTGVALVIGYALLGATWLVMKTDGALQAWSRRVARWCTVAVMVSMVVVSIRTALANPAISERWFGEMHFLWLWPVPLVTAAAGYALWTRLATLRERSPFLLAIALFLLGYLGLAISLWPHIVPHTVTLWGAVSPPTSQGFTLIAVAITLPIVLGYTAYTYWVFRGKASTKEGYAAESHYGS